RPPAAEPSPGRAPCSEAPSSGTAAPAPGAAGPGAATVVTPAPAGLLPSPDMDSRDGARGPFQSSPGGCMPATTAIAPLSDSRRRASSMPPPTRISRPTVRLCERHRRTVAGAGTTTVATLQQLTTAASIEHAVGPAPATGRAD